MKINSLKLTGICWLSSLCLALFLSPLASYAITVESVPNPRQIHGGWVTDMAEILTDNTETQLNQMISQLEAKNGAEIAVVTVPETAPAASPKEFTTKLFNYWGIGKKGEDNGVLFLISLKDRRVEIETGYGVEGILPDAKVGNIINTKITPRFKQRDFDGGTLAGTKALIVILEPSLGAQLNQNIEISPGQPISGSDSTQPQEQPPGGDVLPWILLFGGSALALGVGGLAIYNRRVFVKPEGRSRIDGGSRPVYCSECKQPMEKVDDISQSYLSEPEKVAQDIGNIKFEGWRCPQCSQQLTGDGFHLIAWVSNSDEFRRCPDCQELTVIHTEKTLFTPTQYQYGTRLITDKCQCCSYQRKKAKIIPTLLHLPTSHSRGGYSSGASGGGGFFIGGGGGSAGSGGGSGGGGSGGGGGGFGGGSSGGGGGGGGW